MSAVPAWLFSRNPETTPPQRISQSFDLNTCLFLLPGSAAWVYVRGNGLFVFVLSRDPDLSAMPPNVSTLWESGHGACHEEGGSRRRGEHPAKGSSRADTRHGRTAVCARGCRGGDPALERRGSGGECCSRQLLFRIEGE